MNLSQLIMQIWFNDRLNWLFNFDSIENMILCLLFNFILFANL